MKMMVFPYVLALNMQMLAITADRNGVLVAKPLPAVGRFSVTPNS